MNLRPISLRFSCLAVWLTCLGLLTAAEQRFPVLKIGTEVYTNVTVTSVTASDLYFSHSLGMGNAKLKNLDPELQKRFHYDPEKAAAKEKQALEANAIYVQAAKAAKPAKPPAQAQTPDADDDEIPPHDVLAKSFLNKLAPVTVAEKYIGQLPATHGKFVIVNFWATWSTPSRGAIPGLNALMARFPDRLAVIGLTDEPEETVRKMAAPKVDFCIAIDTEHRARDLVGVQRIPHALLMDPHGIVRFEGNPGYLDEKKLAKLMERFAD